MPSDDIEDLQEATIACLKEPPMDSDWVRHHEDLKDDTTLMRFVSRKYFLEMIETCRNTLMHVSKWADVYEGLVYRRKYFTMSNNVKCPVSLENVYSDFFGQCWTKAKYDSELLWNARCPDKDGVCLKTTLGKLASSVARTMPSQYLAACCRIDKIGYQNATLLDSWIKQYAATALSCFTGLMDLFFVKRESFGDEDEVRLIYVYNSPSQPDTQNFYAHKEFVQYEIAKDDFLTEVLLDPRMSASECQEIKCAVCKAQWRFNGKPLEVNQSDLYQSTVNEFII